MQLGVVVEESRHVAQHFYIGFVILGSKKGISAEEASVVGRTELLKKSK